MQHVRSEIRPAGIMHLLLEKATSVGQINEHKVNACYLMACDFCSFAQSFFDLSFIVAGLGSSWSVGNMHRNSWQIMSLKTQRSPRVTAGRSVSVGVLAHLVQDWPTDSYVYPTPWPATLGPLCGTSMACIHRRMAIKQVPSSLRAGQHVSRNTVYCKSQHGLTGGLAAR